MPSAKKTGSAKGKQSRVQVRDLKPKKDAKGGSLNKLSLSSPSYKITTLPGSTVSGKIAPFSGQHLQP